VNVNSIIAHLVIQCAIFKWAYKFYHVVFLPEQTKTTKII